MKTTKKCQVLIHDSKTNTSDWHDGEILKTVSATDREYRVNVRLSNDTEIDNCAPECVKEITTTIHSNGSKWAGEDNNTISDLISVLKTETIEERFFTQYRISVSQGVYEMRNYCPISDNPDGSIRFFGNFEELSHVFRIDTNDEKIIYNLTEAIKANKGWALYYEKNLAPILT